MLEYWTKSRWRGFALALLAATAGPAAGEGTLTFDEAWVRPLPPGMGMTAAYGALRNGGDETLELTGFSSPEFGDVSLHRTEQVDGVSRMREVRSVALAAGEALQLAPGGYHLMLMQPTTPVAAGQQITVTVTVEGGREFNFQVPVAAK